MAIKLPLLFDKLLNLFLAKTPMDDGFNDGVLSIFSMINLQLSIIIIDYGRSDYVGFPFGFHGAFLLSLSKNESGSLCQDFDLKMFKLD